MSCHDFLHFSRLFNYVSSITRIEFHVKNERKLLSAALKFDDLMTQLSKKLPSPNLSRKIANFFCKFLAISEVFLGFRIFGRIS